MDVAQLVAYGEGLTQSIGRPLDDGAIMFRVRHVATAMSKQKPAEVALGVADRDFERVIIAELSALVERL